MAAPATKLVRAAQGIKYVKHIVSANQTEAKGRARDLYKAWYRQMESIRQKFVFICKVVF